MSARRELTVLRLERQEKDFLKSTSNSHITLSFLSYSFGIKTTKRETTNTFMHSLENHTRVQTRISKVYTPFQTKTAQKPYPLGYPPPPPGIVWNIPPRVIQSSQSLTDSSHSVQNHRYPRVLGLACKIKIISKISLNEKELFPSYKTADKK